MSVCLSARISAPPTGRIFVKFGAKDLPENPAHVGQQYRPLHVKTQTQVRLIVVLGRKLAITALSCNTQYILLLIVTRGSTIHGERAVVFPLP
jgi:hypothetical protein